MLKKVVRPVLVSTVLLNLTVAFAAAPNPDDVPGLSTPQSAFEDFSSVSNYAKKAVGRLEHLGLFSGTRQFKPNKIADKHFARKLLGTLNELVDIEGDITVADARNLISSYLLAESNNAENITISIDGFLSKKGLEDTNYISRQDFAYMVAHAKQIDITKQGESIHNPAIATPGPLLGPTVYQSGTNSGTPVYDGSTVSLFHRARNTTNTTFNESPVLTLQVHPEVFKSVSVGGIDVEALQRLSAQLEVELTDGTIHRTPLTSLTPFSIHGADGKAGVIRVEDGLLTLVDDLRGNVDSFVLNGHTFSVVETIERIENQSYENGDRTNSIVIDAVKEGLNSDGFSLQDRRLMAHNLTLTKTALQQSGLTPLGAPFNTIAGPSSRSRGFREGYLYKLYERVQGLRSTLKNRGNQALRESLERPETQEELLTGTKILTAATLLPHISSLSNAPFLPNEGLSSRVKKAGALLPSEPVSFQFDRLKRAAYILMDDALSSGSASHLVTTGEIIDRGDTDAAAFELKAGNFSAVPLNVKESILADALKDYSDAYETLVYLISGVEFSSALTDLNTDTLNSVENGFSHSILSGKMSNIKIGDLEFKIDILATPSHVQSTFTPENDLTQSRQAEAFGLSSAQNPFPIRLAKYICEGKVFSNSGELISESKLNSDEQVDLIKDFSGESDDCVSAVNGARYHQLLFVDNFQLPPFGPEAKFISTQGIEIINRLLLTPIDTATSIADIRLSYRLIEPQRNNAPIAVISGLEEVKSGSPFVLDAKGSTDADGNTLQYQWKVKSGDAEITQSRFSSKATILPKSKGDLVIELQVNDGIANSEIIEKTIRIKGDNSGGGSTGLYFLSLMGLIYLVRRKGFK